ncbi:DUF350 domain-containing protein [Lactobacillus helveticus]|uniref:DUF350 domain-containing protein n=1 Tax=Lactobacillus helveticus TaxID=1587 RepID=UPI00156404FD|nr:hypothetical protein [Lactobacillus helveticus]NRO18269.1 hypothetical protein [Lactobacillus helveticus]
MIDWVMIGFYTVMLLLGVWQLYRVYDFYKWDKKAKILPTAPAVIFYGGYFGVVLILTSITFMTGTTNIKFGHTFYVIVGILLMLAALAIFRRGRKMSKKLKKDDSNLEVVQTYLIAFVLLFTGFLNFFK